LAKVGVRAEPEAGLSGTLGAGFGRARRDPHGTLVIGSGPGEWLLLDAPASAPRLIDRIRRAAAGEFASVLDLSHARALVRLTGHDSMLLLAKLCAIDLHDETTPDGAALRTSVADLVTDLVREDEDGVRSYWLHCEWSSGQYLFDVLLDAGAEFGIDVDGFRWPSVGSGS
jgi:heterotetrameric sarcosine oxidase gamma subunit